MRERSVVGWVRAVNLSGIRNLTQLFDHHPQPGNRMTENGSVVVQKEHKHALRTALSETMSVVHVGADLRLG